MMKQSPQAQRIAIALILGFASSGAVSAGPPKQEICRAVAKHKESATFLTEQGDKIVTSLQLGEFDFSDRRSEGDFIPSKIKYRLILRPRSILLEDDCSLATCTERVEVRATCPGSREYLVKVSVNPRKFIAGDFDTDIYFRLFDSKYGYMVEDSSPLAPQRTIYGKFHMPWAELLKSADVADEVAGLVHGRRSRVELTLINKGNRPLKLRNWDYEVGDDKTIALDPAGCKETALVPGATCKVALTNVSGKAATGKYMSLKSASVDEDAIVSIYLVPQQNGKVDYNVKNN
jgi:hypothetical protein